MSASILVVDDSPTIRKVVCSILDDHGYEAIQAEDGEDALEKLENNAVDLVLLDFVMPKMNGYQFCREVRSDDRYKRLSIVLMSAKGDKIRGQFVQQTGALDAITKPFDPMALLAVVEGALKKAAARSERPMPDGETMPPEDPESVILPETLELSDDPGLRREQVARAFSRGLSRLIGPAIVELTDSPPDSGERLTTALEKSITPDKLGGLTALLKLLDVGGEGADALAGDLSFISIAEVLQMLELQRQTGALTIASTVAEVTLYLRQGRIDLAQGRGLAGDFRLGRYLVGHEVLTREELDHFLNNRGGSKRLIGDALIQLAHATEEQVRAALKRQTSEIVYEAVRWHSGRFSFVIGATCPEATLAQLDMVPGGILMEGFRRVDEWQLIEGSFDFDEVLFRDQVTLERMTDASQLTGQERQVLDAIDGERTVRQIMQDVDANTFDVCKILYQFLNQRMVRRKAA